MNKKLLTVSALAEHCGMSRSSLLYYERIGLLVPSRRSSAGYRLYDQADVERLQRILDYRATGVPLAEIGALLDAPRDRWAEILEQRLHRINEEIGDLRRQQQILLNMLRSENRAQPRPMDKEGWVALLRECGMSDDDMWQWHCRFEQRMPDGHQEFLVSLGLAADEISAIRERSRG